LHYFYENLTKKIDIPAQLYYNTYITVREAKRNMPISDNLKFLCSTLERCHIRVLMLDADAFEYQELDMGIRRMLGSSLGLGHYISNKLFPLEKKTLYRLSDKFNTSYVFFRLSEEDDGLALFIGPFHPTPLDRDRILAMIEQANIPATLTLDVEKYYSSIPYLPTDSHIFTMINVFCETMWKVNRVVIKEVNAASDESSDWYTDTSPTTPDVMSWKIKMTEDRYKLENKMLAAVAKGDTDKIKTITPIISAHNLEQRLSDNLRNTKNYAIIMNTLLRKAAENGGVHPIYIDKTSSRFAAKIENLRNIDQAGGLMQEMLNSYCKLVKKHSTKSYSLPVQKAITVIEYDLTADLSLAGIARMLDINPSYLSTIFKTETGKTLTDYVNGQRMEAAKHLLETTRLQIQTIAQQCGILDVHYFSRMFKKHTGVTPKMYRETLQK
jgi:AraC-like DNA-binding protein